MKSVTKMKRYQPISGLKSPRFSQIRTFARLPHIQDLNNVDLAIVGVPFDTGATYRAGARFGPSSIREQSMIIRKYNHALNVNVYDHCSCVDYGDMDIVPGYIEPSFQKISEQAFSIIKSDVIPIFLGGDHSVSYPLLKAIHKKHGKVALIHFDSHTDLYPKYFGNYETHGTPFRMAVEEDLIDTSSSIQIGLRGSGYGPEDLTDIHKYGLDYITAEEMHSIGMEKTIQRILTRVNNEPCYITFDIDFIDPAFAPGTGTPEVGGPSSHQAIQLIRGLKNSNILGFDLVEVLPSYDNSKVTSLLAANIVFEFMSLIAYYKMNNS